MPPADDLAAAGAALTAPAPPSLFLIRHAESEWNASGRWQGHADPSLSDRGSGQARLLAERAAPRLRELGVRRIECSDLRRARQTARPLADALGLQIQVDARYRELDVGEWSGLLRVEIEARDAECLARFSEEEPAVRPPGGETRLEIRARARAAAEALARRYGDAPVVVVTHLGFIRALVPGAEPANCELFETSLREVLSRRGVASQMESAAGGDRDAARATKGPAAY